MELVQNSAEHHFITQLDQLSGKTEGWHCLYFSLSKIIGHQSLISDLSAIQSRMEQARIMRDQFLKDIQEAISQDLNGFIYAFCDLDVLVLVQAQKDSEKNAIKDIFRGLSQKIPKGFSDISLLAGTSQAHQKLADQKLLATKLQDSYRSMADTNKVSSIAARRKRRKDPLVMVVEDDRFTAHYASTIISKEYDLVMCRNAEEAIAAYIENAPDIVFMDIHLPGLSGHDATEAIYAVDADAFIVMLSVDTVKENIIKASQNGARKFLKKPFTRDRLLDTVKCSPYVRALMRTTSTGHDTLMS
jgi:two-component system chemotaxis response regulator CheY